jgi:hypothetical protein
MAAQRGSRRTRIEIDKRGQFGADLRNVSEREGVERSVPAGNQGQEPGGLRPFA